MKTTLRLNPRAIVWLLFAAGALFLAVTGCSTETQSGFATSDDSDEEVIATPEPLNLLAIGVPQFDEEVARQWAAERDGDLKVTHVSVDEFLESTAMPNNIDLIVHPSSILVDLVSNDLIRPFPRKGLMSPEMNLDSYLTHFRRALVRHDDKTWSVSLGGHQLRLFYRKDILDAAGIRSPGTWSEFNRVIEKLKDVDEAKGLAPVVFPTTDGMAAQVYLGRVASLIRDQGKLTSFFDRRDMKPTITAEVFSQALNELKAIGVPDGIELSVADAFTKFANGEAVFAIAWPELAEEFDEESLEKASSNWGVARLPGSGRYFDLRESNWRDRRSSDDLKVDILGIAANNISITNGTANAIGSVELVTWLSEKRNSQKLLPGVAAPFRATHLGRIGQWYSVAQADRSFLDEFADSIEATHDSRIALIFPQVPGKYRYLQLLDAAVSNFLNSDDGDAQKTLQRVADEWEELTESLDRKNQIKELRKANGI